jgi:hypothetical protein
MSGLVHRVCSRRSRKSTGDDFRAAIEKCNSRAKHSADDDVRAAWLYIADSYGLLLILGKIKLDGALINAKE